MHSTAPAPTRSTTSFVLSFGLLNIPVSLYTTITDTRVARKEFTADGHPVGRKMYDKETGADVAYGDIVKMVEIDGVAVALSDEEIAEATGHVSGVAPIVGRVSMSELNNDFIVETVYQLRPKSDKKSQSAANRAFVLLMQTLENSDEAALVRISIRGAVAKWGAVTPDGYLRIVHSADQVRSALPMPDVEVSAKEAELAAQLLAAIPTVSVSELRDDSSERVAEFVEAKIASLSGITVAHRPTAESSGVLVEDMFAQLEASLTAAKVA